MIDLDGPTVSDNKFSGPIGKLISSVLDMPVLTGELPDIGVNIELIELDDKLINDLSADQKYMYQIVTAIKDRKLPTQLQNNKIGPHNHARWLNLANRICRMWCSEHNLDEENAQKLKLLVQFVVGVYAPMWFLIKRDYKMYQGPGHMIEQLKRLRNMDDGVVKIVIKYVKTSAWFAHP